MSSTPGPTPTDAASVAAEALRDALHAEHAAVYGYGFAAARSTAEQRDLCLAYLDEHRDRRDTLRAALVARGVTPPPGEHAYALPEDTGEESLAAFAVGLEESTAQAYLELAAVADVELRELAGRALRATTLRTLALDAPLDVFPGFPGGEL